MADESHEDLDNFLSKIDDIHRIVENLTSNDENVVSKAMQESDNMLKEIPKTGFDRTVINKSTSDIPPTQQQNMSADAFMSAIEKDANERAERRRQNKILADELKAKGNAAFHQQLYDEAIDYYTQGLKLKKDYDILYTNRAQVYVKQARYEEAIIDCEWALKVTPEYIKAFVIKGKCLIYLKQFDRAKEMFIEVREIANKNFEPENTRHCIELVEREREKHQREEAARIFITNEDPSKPMSLSHTLNKLNVDQQPIIYYTGGIDLLCQLIKDETTKTAFRINHGFDLLNNHQVISENENEVLNQSIFNLMNVLSQDDDENTKLCLDSKYLNNYFKKSRYSSAALKYLVDISLKPQMRIILIQKIQLNEFVQCLLNIMNENNENGLFATKLLSNLALEHRIKQLFNEKNDLIKLISILKSRKIDESIRAAILSLLTNVCSEKSIRISLLNQTETFQILINNFQHQENEYQFNLLGLLVNLTSESNIVIQENYKNLCEVILKKLNNSIYHQRILALLGNLVMHYVEAVDILVNYDIVGWISRDLQQISDEELIRSAIRLLALCTQSNEQIQKFVADDTRLLSIIHRQLITSQHSLLIGNASLLFGNVIIHLASRKFLRKTIGIDKIMSQMLKLVEESWLTKPARKNVAIFITKMVKADENFLEEYRKQHGTEILHSALKDVDL